MNTAAKRRDTILDKLIAGAWRAWRAGHRIPTERALSDEFGLSRSTVRRVLLVRQPRSIETWRNRWIRVDG